MSPAANSPASPAHPAPHRDKVSGGALAFGLLAAPAAWGVNELAQYYLASRLCLMKSSVGAPALSRADHPGFIAIALATFLITLWGVWMAAGCWQRSRNEHLGEGHHLIERGEGRTRFLAMTGLITSAGFAIAFLFMFAQLFMAPLCGKLG